MNRDLKIIKKKYGKKMMKFCRQEFPTILEHEGLLVKILTDNFAESHTLYEDIVGVKTDFKNFIISKSGNLIIEDLKDIDKNPYELLSEAGYDLYKCTTEEEVQSFKKYYARGEELCTFNEERLNTCYVYFAVKRNVAEIKRENFKNPKREDLYGSSVLSIQFTRDDFHRVSIKSRYNHAVDNPDATFANNLDNIISGLTASFAKYEGMFQRTSIKKELEIPNYIKASDNKYYKYNSKVENVYFCPNNIIVDNGIVKKYNKDNYLIIDNYILDLQNKEIFNYNGLQDSFVDTITDITKIEVVNQENKEIHIETNKGNVLITLNDNNQIIAYSNDYIEEIKDDAFIINNTLTSFYLPKVKTIGHNVLFKNNTLNSLYLPAVKTIGNQFLYFNRVLNFLNAPNLEAIGNNFLYNNENLMSISLPSVKAIENNFLFQNKKLTNFEVPNLEKIGHSFLFNDYDLTSIILPQVKTIGNFFLDANENLSTLYAPNLETIGFNNLMQKKTLTACYCPLLTQNGYNIEKNDLEDVKVKRRSR